MTHTVSIDVKLQEWATFQRNAAHSGYVPVKLDPTKFAKAWELTTADSARFGGLVPAKGAVYLTAGYKAYRLNEATGATVWTYRPPEQFVEDRLGPPGYQNDAIYFPTITSHSTAAAVVRGLDAATGAFKSESSFLAQAGSFNSPAFFEGAMYFSEGRHGNVAYRYALPSGATTWSATLPVGFNFGQTPAVDANYVYHLSGFGIVIVDRLNGAVVANVPNSISSGTPADVRAPVLASDGIVLAVDWNDNARLMAISSTSRSILWRGLPLGGCQPVTSGKVVYAWTPTLGWSVSALDATTGAIQWSWFLPAGESQLIENMIVTDNLLLVSSTKNIYAIDLKTRQTVWTYAGHGKLSLSSSLVLYVLQSDYGVETSKITAIKLAT